MSTKEIFFEGYRWAISECQQDWEDCKDCWNASNAKKEMEDLT